MVASLTLAWAQLGRPGVRGCPRMKQDVGYLWSQMKGMEMLFLKTERARDSLEAFEGPSLPLTPGTCQVCLHWASHPYHLPSSIPDHSSALSMWT